MGLVRATISLKNPRLPELKPLEADALADTGAPHLCIPEHVAVQLKLETLEQREVTFADGRRRSCDYVGPVEVRFDGRGCFVGALVFGDDILLGSVPMEDMDLVVHPATRTVGPNPANPNIPGSVAK